jgi:DNA-binding IclR family transcriptional regulator
MARQAATTQAEDEEGGQSTFRVIARATDLLKCLSGYPAGLTLTEISRETKLHKATTARFLKALAEGGFVAAVPTRKAWKLGPVIVQIASRAAEQTDIREVARPIMERASLRTHATVQLAILADGGVVYVEKIEPEDLPLRIHTQIGSRRPLHCTALGKVMAAFRDWSDVERMVGPGALERRTERSITDRRRLKAELSRVRAQEFAVDDREYNDLVVCTAAPIRDASGDVVAALSISTFGIATDSARFRVLISEARATAKSVSTELGWRASEAPETRHRV